MGLLKTITEKVSKAVLTPITAAGNLITAGLEKVTGKEYGRTTPEEASKTAIGKAISVGIVGTAAALVPAVVGTAATTAAVKKAVTSKAALTAGTIAVLAPKTTEKVIESEELTRTAVAVAVGGPVAGYIVGAEQGASLIGQASKNIIEKVKDVTPEVKAAAIGASVVAAGAGLAAATGVFEKEKEISSKVPEIEPGTFQLTPEQQKALTTSEDKPITQETQTISTTAKKRKRKSRKKDITSVNQSVRVNVINRAVGFQTSKKYINNEIMA